MLNVRRQFPDFFLFAALQKRKYATNLRIYLGSFEHFSYRFSCVYFISGLKRRYYESNAIIIASLRTWCFDREGERHAG